MASSLPPLAIGDTDLLHAFWDTNGMRVKDSHYLVYQLDSKVTTCYTPFIDVLHTCTHCYLIIVFLFSRGWGGLGPSFAPPIQQTADSSNVAGALSFDAFAFFATNAGTPTIALGVGADRIAHLYHRLGSAFTVSQHAVI